MAPKVGICLEERGKIYWHEAFFEALQLELYQYRDSLIFESEHRLNEEALQMDVLVIKKDEGVQIKKNIGRIFRGHNIFEYKSETDSFSRWDYNKVLGYAYLYSALEQIPMADITVTIALTIYPRELVKALEREQGLTVMDLGDGIYRVDGEVVPVQILESKRLSAENNLFLRNLRSNLSAVDMKATLYTYKEHMPLNIRAAFLDRLVKANHDVFMEVINMGETALDIFLEGAERYGWLVDRDKSLRVEQAKMIARKMLMRGLAVEDVVEDTGLSYDVVVSLL